MTKLAILGSSGFVGKHLLERALAAGHSVRTLVRSPEKLGPLRDKVEVIRGDMHDPAALRALVAGVDAVISVAGPPLDRRHHDSERHAAAMQLLVDEMVLAGVRRIVTIAGAAAEVPGRPLGLRQRLLRLVLRFARPAVIRTKDLEVATLAASELVWTVVRPPLVRSGSPSGRTLAREDDMPGTRIDVADLTAFLLLLLDTDEWNRRAPVVASMPRAWPA